MKKNGNTLAWIGVGFLAILGIGAFGSGDILSGVIVELVAIALIPVSPIKDLWLKLPEKFKWVKSVSLIVLFLIGMSFSAPAEEAKVSQPETAEDAIVTQEEKRDGKETKEEPKDAQKVTAEQEKEKSEKDELPPETTTKTTENEAIQTPVVTTTQPPTATTKTPTTTTQAPTTTTQAPTTTTAAPTTTTAHTQSPGGNGDPDHDDTNGQIVYRTPSGKRWHLDPQCGGANSYSVTRNQAESAGLTPCQKCAK